jgi:hypothetical protein
MNRTRGFVNLNRFKSSKAVKRLSKVTVERQKRGKGEKNR